jgi:hypothetical protein
MKTQIHKVLDVVKKQYNVTCKKGRIYPHPLPKSPNQDKGQPKSTWIGESRWTPQDKVMYINQTQFKVQHTYTQTYIHTHILT